MAARETNMTRLKKFMQDSESSILSVEAFGNDEWRMVLVWSAGNRQKYVKAQGQGYNATLQEIADLLAHGQSQFVPNGIRKLVKGNV